MQFNSKLARRALLSVAGVCSLSLPFMQPATAQQVRSFCGKYESTFVAVETSHFWVNICGGDTPHHYVGVDKKTRKAIRLPLSVDGAQNKGRYYEAVNGEYTYGLNLFKRTKNLTVKRNNSVILREAIVRGF